MSRAYKFRYPDTAYFVTYTTVGWVDVLTRPQYKDIIVQSLKHCQETKGLQIYAWVIMTNHVHMITRAAEGFKMEDIMRDHKKFTSKELLKAIATSGQESRKEWMLRVFKERAEPLAKKTEYQLWQHGNHPIWIESPHIVEQKLNYIHMNPVAQGWVEEPEHYLYSSARDFAGLPGMLKLEEL